MNCQLWIELEIKRGYIIAEQLLNRAGIWLKMSNRNLNHPGLSQYFSSLYLALSGLEDWRRSNLDIAKKTNLSKIRLAQDLTTDSCKACAGIGSKVNVSAWKLSCVLQSNIIILLQNLFQSFSVKLKPKRFSWLFGLHFFINWWKHF